MLHNYKNELEIIQKEITDITKLAIVIVDSFGNYVTQKDNYSEFCSSFRKNKELSYLCKKCDIKAINQAFSSSKPYIYKCHSGLIDIAVPLIYEDKYIGAILVGQAILKDTSILSIDKILNDNAGKNIDMRFFINSYANLKKLSYPELTSIANMVYYTSFYIIDSIKSKRWFNHDINNNLNHNVGKVELLNSPIELAIEYIKNNLNENIKLQTLATLCNFSVSHFSRIFKKEVGKTLKEYVNIKKLEKAKYLLESTNDSICQISEELGLEDSSYFTKVFKKYEGICPKKYRESFEKTNKIEIF